MQEHQIARHDLATGDAFLHPCAHYQCAWTGQIAQRLERAFGLALLIDGDAHYNEHGHQQDKRFAKIAEGKVDRAACNQQQQHRFTHDFQRNPRHVPALRRRQFIWAVQDKTPGRLDVVQTGFAGLRGIGLRGARCDAHLTSVTGSSERCRTCNAVEPTMMLARTPWPRVPMTIRVHPRCNASLTMASPA